jgi:hypothetical protein
MTVTNETMLSFLRELVTELEEKCEDDWWRLVDGIILNPDDFPLEEKIRRGNPILSNRLNLTRELIQQLEGEKLDTSYWTGDVRKIIRTSS